MTRRLERKTALVCGAGSVGPGFGNGKASATLFAREGASVMCADINEAAALETRDIIRGEGGTAEAIACDVSDRADVARIVAATVDRFEALDVLLNVVGILTVGGPVETTESDWDRVMDVNLKSVYLTCKHAIPVMQARGGGAIVNISSIAGLRFTGVPYASYNASKAGVSHLTRVIAVQHATDNIRCNSISPGFMRTPMVEQGLAETYADGDVDKMFEMRASTVPMKRGGDAWDVAYAALYLACDESGYVTGHDLVVDGGITATCVQP